LKESTELYINGEGPSMEEYDSKMISRLVTKILQLESGIARNENFRQEDDDIVKKIKSMIEEEVDNVNK
jgi:hypothetical protein